MRKLSDKAAQLTQELYELDQKSGWFGRSRQGGDIVARIVELAVYSEPASIPCICRFLFSKEPVVRESATEAIASIMADVAPLDLLQLADAFNWEYGWYAGQEWSHLRKGSVRKLARTQDGGLSAGLLGLLSFHRNGYVREEAVKLLAQMSDGAEVPYLLIRQNDWVTAISRLAQRAVKERLGYSYSQYWFNNLDLVAHLPEFGRNDLSHITDATFSQLLEPEHDGRLRSLIASGDRITIRRFVKRSFELPGSHSERVAKLGIDAEDAVVRLWSARKLLTLATDSPLIDRLLSDSFAPVRREAYIAWAASSRAEAEMVWKQAAYDRSAGVRDLARFELKTQGLTNIREQYLASLQEEPENLAALMGLSECCEDQDAQLLREYCSHDRPRFRRVAISGLARLLGDQVIHELVGWLADESPGVAKQAARSLQAHAAIVEGEQLWSVLTRSPTDNGRRTCLRLFYEMGKWKSLPWLIRAFTLNDQLVSEQSEELARRWLDSNRVFTQPSLSEQDALTNAYREAKAMLPESFAAELRARLPFLLPDEFGRTDD
ncbi:HEAT repeat domain-containing protein [Botrimarina hoheduenensis]|uniref:HEAT repeat protein n=1 Tax=Botrimarina hoheduenensis TaxID=2528000 RepID=A0A5C5WEE8_9BACT|nr:hypothetical protein [Botrimarina hoheduenensis]TWT48990.1 HEAT repeat protein [Botrimarina hoheduenensis]